MERQVQCKHFIKYLYLSYSSIKQTFLGCLLYASNNALLKICRNAPPALCRQDMTEPQAFQQPKVTADCSSDSGLEDL